MAKNVGDREELPLLYRLVLRLPKPSLDNFSEFHGVFWAVIVPLAVAADVFLNLVLLVFLPFPLNYASVAVVTGLVTVFIFRILLERTLNAQRAALGQSRFRWNVDEKIRDYQKVLERLKDDRPESAAQSSESET